jgi:hypothetical protein
MTKDNSKVDISGLRSFYLFDPAAKLLLDHFSKFVNNMGTTKIDQLLWRLSNEPNPPSRGTVIKFFQKLEELGCGHLVWGRKGKKTRFVWGSNLTDVSKAAAGQDIKIGIALTPAEVEEAEEAAANVESKVHDDTLVEHPFRLRKDLDVRLRLPADLTKAEAARLAAFIQTLPFEEEQSATA